MISLIIHYNMKFEFAKLTTITHTLLFFLILQATSVITGQDRITEIYKEESKANSHLTTYNQQNYLVTITPDDIVNFYLIHDNETRELVRTKNIEFAYQSGSKETLVKENYFVLFSDVEIVNYDFIHDETRKYSINNPLPPNYGIGIYDRDQDGVEFSLNSTQYIYYYKENRLEICNGSIYEKYGDHLVMRESINGLSQYFYSNNYGKDKKLILTYPERMIIFVSMYNEYLLASDSIGNIIKYTYNSDQDTLILNNKILDTRSKTSVHETESYLITFFDYYNDSTEVKVYDKSNLNLLNIYKMRKGSYVTNKHIIQNGTSLAFYTGMREIHIFNPLQNKHLILKNPNFYYQFKLCLIEDKLFVILYENNKIVAKLINMATFESTELNTSDDLKTIYGSENQWKKIGSSYYYNLPANYEQSSLFRISLITETIKKLVTENYFVGVKKSHPLKKYGEDTYLLTDDLYLINESSYSKVNTQPLDILIYYAKDPYKQQDDGLIYAQKSSGKKDLYFLTALSHKKIFTLEPIYDINDIMVNGDYALMVDIEHKLYLINIQAQTIQLIENDIEIIANVNFLLKDDKYFYYRRFGNLMLFDPITQFKKKLDEDHLSLNFPMTIINGKTTFIFDHKISQLEPDLTLVNIVDTISYMYTIDFKKVKEDLFYFVFRTESSYQLYKFDGQNFYNIYNDNSITLSSVTDQNLVFLSSDTIYYKYKTHVFVTSNNTVYHPTTKDSVLLNQVFRYKGYNTGLFQTFDSLYFVHYNDDFSSYSIINQTYAPHTVQAQILGTLQSDKVLISTGNEFMFMDEHLDIHTLDILPNNVFKNLLLTDSIYYFMAISYPYGNQVYAFNHVKYSRFINGINDDNIQTSSIGLYPNPATTFIHLIKDNLGDLETNTEYSIFNISGMCIEHSILPSDLSINVHHLQTGLYFLILNNRNKQMATKFSIIK